MKHSEYYRAVEEHAQKLGTARERYQTDRRKVYETFGGIDLMKMFEIVERAEWAKTCEKLDEQRRTEKQQQEPLILRTRATEHVLRGTFYRWFTRLRCRHTLLRFVRDITESEHLGMNRCFMLRLPRRLVMCDKCYKAFLVE